MLVSAPVISKQKPIYGRSNMYYCCMRRRLPCYISLINFITSAFETAAAIKETVPSKPWWWHYIYKGAALLSSPACCVYYKFIATPLQRSLLGTHTFFKEPFFLLPSLFLKHSLNAKAMGVRSHKGILCLFRKPLDKYDNEKDIVYDS